MIVTALEEATFPVVVRRVIRSVEVDDQLYRVAHILLSHTVCPYGLLFPLSQSA